MNTKSVLVTGGRSPVALNLIRMLHQDGHHVYVAESETYHLSKKTKAIIKNFIVPKPNEDFNGFIHAILKICIEQGIHIIIPTCEEIFYLSQAKHLFEQNQIQLFCDDIEKLDLLHNKYEFNQFLSINGFTHPLTQQFTSLNGLQQYISSLSHHQKIVLKPSYSCFASNVYIIQCGEPINDIPVTSDIPWLVQEFIEGEQFCTFSISVKGKLVAHTCYPSVYTAGLGANVYFKAIVQTELQQFVKQVVAKLNFTGQIAFDFIKGKDGKFYPIECNPRATSGLHLFNGINNFSSVFINPQINVTYMPSLNATYKIGIPMFLYGIKEGYFFREPHKFLTNYLNATDVVYSNTDKLPYYYQVVFFSILLARKIKSGKVLTELTTSDIEWSGRKFERKNISYRSDRISRKSRSNAF